MTGRILGVLVAAALLAGCQDQPQAPANDRQARLLAAQSADSQKELAAARKEIEALRQKHAQELQRRDEELANCRARIEVLQKDIEKGIAERVTGVTTALLEENARLRQEIERLKTNAPPENVP